MVILAMRSRSVGSSAYEKQISISGVGFDIGCGNMAARLDTPYYAIQDNVGVIMRPDSGEPGQTEGTALRPRCRRFMPASPFISGARSGRSGRGLQNRAGGFDSRSRINERHVNGPSAQANPHAA